MSTLSLKRVMVGLSGGVDSSVALLLLKQQGFEVEALFMKNWEEDDTDTHCGSATDLKDAEAVCRALQVKLHIVNFSKEYWERVFEHFLKEYKAGRTPNPDILCNREIKFKAFLEHALQLGAEKIATGHYAINQDNHLHQAFDLTKDQSYFLYTLGQKALSKSLFPLGTLKKTEVRMLAQKAGLINHQKKDSTGICFIGKRNFKTFLSRYLPAQPGLIETPEGLVIGQHDGLMYYTIGQRQGLGIGGLKESANQPYYVVGKALKRNALIVASDAHPWLYRSSLEAKDLHWVSGKKPETPLNCSAKIRYRQSSQLCEISVGTGRARPQIATVHFKTPQRAVTPGQAIVFYAGTEVLGGGTIL